VCDRESSQRLIQDFAPHFPKGHSAITAKLAKSKQSEATRCACDEFNQPLSHDFAPHFPKGSFSDHRQLAKSKHCEAAPARVRELSRRFIALSLQTSNEAALCAFDEFSQRLIQDFAPQSPKG
jgi:hypothetical protein